MAHHDVLMTVRRLQERLSTLDGVVVRILECSLNCTAKHTEMPILINGHPRMRHDCVDGELSRRLRPASLLRWDAPAAIFNAGRCAHPSVDETLDVAPAAKMTHDGYYPHGFVGHNVTSAGIGWVLKRVGNGSAVEHLATMRGHSISAFRARITMQKWLIVGPLNRARQAVS